MAAGAAAARLRRRFSAFAGDILREYQLGRPPQVVPFEIDEAEARRKFLSWQSGAVHVAPSSLLPPGGPWRLRATLLPFWMFDVRARVEYNGTVGMASKQGAWVEWHEVGWKEVPHREYSWQHDCIMRVYASFKYRRDYAQVVNRSWSLKRLQPLPEADAARGNYVSATLTGRAQGADVDPPTMRQAIAWEFVLRDIREREPKSGS